LVSTIQPEAVQHPTKPSRVALTVIGKDGTTEIGTAALSTVADVEGILGIDKIESRWQYL
jgi:hypothetical protein